LLDEPWLQTLSGHTSAVETVRFDGQEESVVAGSSSGTLKIYDLKKAKGRTLVQFSTSMTDGNGTAFRTLTGHTSSIRCIDYHTYGYFIGSGSLDTTVKVSAAIR
jgi:katanin p80 WD40 repeat-containing subunit B1